MDGGLAEMVGRKRKEWRIVVQHIHYRSNMYFLEERSIFILFFFCYFFLCRVYFFISMLGCSGEEIDNDEFSSTQQTFLDSFLSEVLHSDTILLLFVLSKENEKNVSKKVEMKMENLLLNFGVVKYFCDFLAREVSVFKSVRK